MTIQQTQNVEQVKRDILDEFTQRYFVKNGELTPETFVDAEHWLSTALDRMAKAIEQQGLKQSNSGRALYQIGYKDGQKEERKRFGDWMEVGRFKDERMGLRDTINP